MKKLGLYIHIPFCRSKCSYCDFYSIVSPPGVINQYLKALIKEINYYSIKYKNAFIVDTIYIGGGTPSLLSPCQIGDLIENIQQKFKVISRPEISIEVNPESLTRDHLKIFHECSINRISMGIQTFNDKILKTIDRRTNKKEIIEKIQLVKGCKFKNISFDLIFGLPYQDMKQLKEDLEYAVKFEPAHLSLYSLILKKGSPVFKLYKEKNRAFMEDDEIADCYFYADDFLSQYKLIRYEVSNFAEKGYECKHNLKYWYLQPYLGIGAAAVSFIDNFRWKNMEDVKKYINFIESKKSNDLEKEEINDIRKYNEKIMLRLRLKHGLNIKELDVQEKKFLTQKKKEIEFYKKLNYLEKHKNQLCLTVKGIMVSNSIISELMIEETKAKIQ